MTVGKTLLLAHLWCFSPILCRRSFASSAISLADSCIATQRGRPHAVAMATVQLSTTGDYGFIRNADDEGLDGVHCVDGVE